MDNTSSAEKEELIRVFRREISSKLLFPISSTAEEVGLNDLFFDLVQVINSSSLTGDDAAEIFDELAQAIDNQPPYFWVNNVAFPIDEGTISRAKLALSFRAERFFRNHYWEKLEGKDLPGKLEFVSERLEELGRIPLRFGQAYVMPALEYLYDDLEREFERRKIALERRAALMAGDQRSGSTDVHENTPEDLPEAARKLADNCLLFKMASHETRLRVWGKLVGFSRNKWALFFIETDPKKGSYASKGDAVNGIVKPKARLIEEISGRTHMRGASINEKGKQYPRDKKAVHEVITLLKADSAMSKLL